MAVHPSLAFTILGIFLFLFLKIFHLFKDVALLSRGFWEEAHRNPHLCFCNGCFPLTTLNIFSLFFFFGCSEMTCPYVLYRISLSCLGFSELLGLWFDVFHYFLENWHSCLFQSSLCLFFTRSPPGVLGRAWQPLLYHPTVWVLRFSLFLFFL